MATNHRRHKQTDRLTDRRTDGELSAP